MSTNRNFYACQCFFKGESDKLAPFGKTIFVFKSDKERMEFLEGKNTNEFYKVTQKEAFKIASLNGSDAVPCVYRHNIFIGQHVLANIRQCWGSAYQLLKNFKVVL